MVVFAHECEDGMEDVFDLSSVPYIIKRALYSASPITYTATILMSFTTGISQSRRRIQPATQRRSIGHKPRLQQQSNPLRHMWWIKLPFSPPLIYATGKRRTDFAQLWPKDTIWENLKGRGLTQSYHKKTYTNRKWEKAKRQHKKNTIKNFDYITTEDRLMTVSWSNDSHKTCVVKPVYGIPNFPLTTTAVYMQSKGHTHFNIM